ncbi:hypothetical protein PPL_11150 [Heterostelium album PN500]|uniref:Rhodanese domain-containing protein n=1 Tax=Heterostelium pallidum (strain ATCC 26659 / Pp 5 / PN500) TaxID=670386 RepID=D3BTP0_HETP5|nr:hypothetical protein PPL_11150 [Heterostelium album PN500]EFA75076.1 hypothetical protein PPL_11150 [Heterostelium album PN500]|eukprot:XP_020427210.1 hypothetical protein PPL_11150 [Heterostelium album PN500]
MFGRQLSINQSGNQSVNQQTFKNSSLSLVRLNRTSYSNCLLNSTINSVVVPTSLLKCNNYSAIKSYSTATSTTTTTTATKEDVYKASVARPSPQRGRRPNKQKSPSFPQYAHIPRLATAGLHRIAMMGFDFYLLDIRPAAEFAAESVVGSVSHPVEHLDKSSEQLDKSSMVLLLGPKEKGYPVACEAALKLQSKGFKSVIVLESSVKELVNAGFFYNAPADIKLN